MKKFMKKGSILIAVLALVLTFENCSKKETLPTASFTFSPSEVFQYEEVQFTSTSSDADSYLWDFGGNTTTEVNPLVTFNDAGDWTVKLTTTNGDGSTTTQQTVTVNAPNNKYMLGDVEYDITTDFFWFQSSAGGDPYLRLLTDEPGQDTVQDLFKLYPNMGLGELERVYTWEGIDLFGDPTAAGTYDVGYTADYDGSFNYAWTAVGKDGSSDLVIEMVVTDVYRMTGNMILSVGYYDWAAGGIFVETSTEPLVLSYVGPITPLP
jgi:PKD repeat protein